MRSINPVESVGLAGLDQINSFDSDERDEAPVARWEILLNSTRHIENGCYVSHTVGLFLPIHWHQRIKKQGIQHGAQHAFVLPAG